MTTQKWLSLQTPCCFSVFKFDCQFWDFSRREFVCAHIFSCRGFVLFFILVSSDDDKYRLISCSPLTVLPLHITEQKRNPKVVETPIDYFDFLFDLSRTRSSLDENCQIRDELCRAYWIFFFFFWGRDSPDSINSNPHKFHNNTPYTQDIGENCRSQLIRDSSFSFFVSCWIDLSPHDRMKWNCLTQIQTFEL